LFHYAEKRLPTVASLSEVEKKHFFKEDTKKTVAILLHEFAQPNGVQDRQFDTSHAISKTLLKSAGFRNVMKQFKNDSCFLDTQTHLRSMVDYRYVMTPRKSETKSYVSQTMFAFKEHLRLACRPNIAQFFLGSYRVNISQLDSLWAEVTIYNETSRNSLFLHVPKSTDKPNIFGTVSQTFKLQICLADFK